MHLNTHVLSLPALFVITGVLAQQSAEPTSGTPDVTYPADDAFVFCSNQDCTGTCEVVDTANIDEGEGEFASQGFKSIYWHDPGKYDWYLYACIDYEYLGSAVAIGPNTCYNLYDNGVPTDFTEYYYLVG